MTEPFSLEAGAVVLVPTGSIHIERSRHAEHFSNTPMICRLKRKGKGGTRYSFVRSDEDEFRTRRTDGESKGFILFVPVGTREGDYLVVQWVEKNCACALRATQDEILNATGTGSSGAWSV